VTIHYAGIFGSRSSLSIFDRRLVTPPLMDRILVEPALLRTSAEPADVEVWTRRLLLGKLGTNGSVIIGPPYANGAPEPIGGLPDDVDRPTALLREARFVSSKEDIPICVNPAGEGRYVVDIRPAPDAPSLCPKDLTLELGYVELQGIVQRMDDDAVVAVIHEVALLEGPEQLSATATLPHPQQDTTGFCRAVAQLFDSEMSFRPTDDRYGRAALTVLDLAFDPLYAPVEPIAMDP